MMRQTVSPLNVKQEAEEKHTRHNHRRRFVQVPVGIALSLSVTTNYRFLLSSIMCFITSLVYLLHVHLFLKGSTNLRGNVPGEVRQGNMRLAGAIVLGISGI
jgi:hypothetical protein